MFVDATAANTESEMSLEARAGIAHLHVSSSPALVAPDGLKFELIDGGTGKAQFVSGK